SRKVSETSASRCTALGNAMYAEVALRGGSGDGWATRGVAAMARASERAGNARIGVRDKVVIGKDCAKRVRIANLRPCPPSTPASVLEDPLGGSGNGSVSSPSR